MSNNNLYVAFTRAIDRLNVFSEVSKSGQGKKRDYSANKISTPIFKAIGEEEFVEFGERAKVNTSKQAALSEVSLRTDLSVNKKVLFSFKPIYPNETIQYNIDYGVHLHAVLSEITKEEDLPDYKSIIEKRKISEEVQVQLQKDIQKIMASKEISALLFENVTECISEHDLISETGKLLRPDRVLLKKDKVIVVDFKTGEPRSKDKKQVSEYIATLQQMHGEHVEGCLVYTRSGELVRV